jgi:hypothetical protein
MFLLGAIVGMYVRSQAISRLQPKDTELIYTMD